MFLLSSNTKMKQLEYYCKNHKKVFILKDDVIYKYIPSKNYFIRMTHWNKNKNRRVPISDLSSGKILHYQKALELINQFWNTLTYEWSYNGHKYKVSADISNEVWGKGHVFNVSNILGEVYYETYYVGLFQNRIIWYGYHEERCLLYKFRDINTKPTYRDFAGFTSKTNIRPIIDCETNEFI